ncbi:MULTISPECIES: SIS domain-containing protein [Enterococcus]|uniref:SIS domain-containing protein n=1 Tax=Enterococcus TaxID=1350 RepID=UPI00065E2CAC|nr:MULTISPECIES: SIS domain-containing protein [Enterococcus]KAF1303176.1 tagatose-6-phosphate ketose isomerase [Enterococcus sp. JM9B]
MFKLSKAELEKQGAAITTAEIMQQPDLWIETQQIYHQIKEKIDSFLAIASQEASGRIRVIFTGAGTSQYVGDTLRPFLNQNGDHTRFDFVSIGTTDIVAAPLDYLQPDDWTILVSFARSGNSPESLAAVKIANQVVTHIRHITITCASEGKLAQQSKNDPNNLLLLMPSGANDQGFAMTGSFSCMLLMALLVFDKNHQKEQFIDEMAVLGREVIERESEIQKIIALDYQRIVYLGSGVFSGLTREASLKVLELTAGKTATVFDSSMGFRHGPKSFVDNKTLVFGFLSNTAYTRQYDSDILEEIAGDKIALPVVAIGQRNDKRVFPGTNFLFNTVSDPLPDGYAALPFLMVAQTVALLSSVKIGNRPDTPSPTGTVNRVVKGVTIHPYE